MSEAISKKAKTLASTPLLSKYLDLPIDRKLIWVSGKSKILLLPTSIDFQSKTCVEH